ncbi:MAG: sialate O-acetylesterase [Armatimonadota bacterium]
MRMIRRVISTMIPIIVYMIGSASIAAVKPNKLFSDGAVLQQGMPIPVWGDADDGEHITVRFLNQKVSTVAKNGCWMIMLKPLTAGSPYSMTITGNNTIELHDILIGEVWIASGQSNMQMQLHLTQNAVKEIADSNDPHLRVFTVPVNAADTPMREFEQDRNAYPSHDMYRLFSGGPKTVTAQWEQSSPSTSGEFSAVAYYFAQQLRKTLKVPVGIINASLGATFAETWTDSKTLKSLSGIQVMTDPSIPTPNHPSTLYNGMIAPLQPYAIRGAIWYQGESNAGLAQEYRTLFPAMISGWRREWKQGDFPFLFVQIAPFMKPQPVPSESAWANLWEAQLLSSLKVSKAGMAVITDAGSQVGIHPLTKQIVGTRLALAARAIAYGECIEYSGPILRSMTLRDDRAVLMFDHAESGLMAKGGDLKGFTIAGDDGKFVWANASIQGDKVVVSSPLVMDPKVVRYGWADFPIVNLFNNDGLPASPFSTEDFPSEHNQPKP